MPPNHPGLCCVSPPRLLGLAVAPSCIHCLWAHITPALLCSYEPLLKGAAGASEHPRASLLLVVTARLERQGQARVLALTLASRCPGPQSQGQGIGPETATSITAQAKRCYPGAGMGMGQGTGLGARAAPCETPAPAACSPTASPHLPAQHQAPHDCNSSVTFIATISVCPWLSLGVPA